MEFKRLRKERNLTQQNVADVLGIPLRTYQNYEREVSEADSEILCKLAELYGITLDELFGRQTHGTKIELLPDELNLIGLYRQMDDDDKRTFLKNAQLFAFAGEAKKRDDERTSSRVGGAVQN